MSASKEFDLHYRLRPVVREIAIARLERRGLRLDSGSPAVRELVGDLLAAREPGPRAATQPAGAGARAGRAPPNSREPGASVMATMTIEELNEQAERILAEVERAVVGKREALELVLLGILSDGHVLIEDFPGLAKTLIARSFAQVTGMTFSRIQFTPDLMPADVTGSSIYNQQRSDFEFRPGPIFAQPPARRRDQPRAAQDAGRAAGGDAGAAGDDRGHDAHPRAAVHRPRHPEPDRVRGHVPAARGAARPLRAPDRRRLPLSGSRVGDAGAAARARGGGGRARPGRRAADAARDAGRARAGARGGEPRPTTSSTSSPRRGTRPASRSGRARAGRSRSSSSPEAAPLSRAATTRRRTT